MNVCVTDYVYDDTDIVSDTIINFYNSNDCKEQLEKFIDLYINDKSFHDYIQKNFLIKKISLAYLLRLYNDYDCNNVVDEYDYITSVNTTRWI